RREGIANGVGRGFVLRRLVLPHSVADPRGSGDTEVGALGCLRPQLSHARWRDCQASPSAREKAGVRLLTLAIALLSAWTGACATTQAPSPLNVEALGRAKLACGAPDARLASDEYHLSIVIDGHSPDRPRQIQCLFD